MQERDAAQQRSQGKDLHVLPRPTRTGDRIRVLSTHLTSFHNTTGSKRKRFVQLVMSVLSRQVSLHFFGRLVYFRCWVCQMSLPSTGCPCYLKNRNLSSSWLTGSCCRFRRRGRESSCSNGKTWPTGFACSKSSIIRVTALIVFFFFALLTLACYN